MPARGDLAATAETCAASDAPQADIASQLLLSIKCGLGRRVASVGLTNRYLDDLECDGATARLDDPTSA